MRVFLLFCLGVLLFSGCSKKGGTDLSSMAQVEVITDPSLFASVAFVILPGGAGTCTGTFISPRAVLTASHCTKNAGLYRVITSYGYSSTYERARLGPGVVGDPTDVAVLVLAADGAKRALGQVSMVSSSVNGGDRVRIVGYGCNDIRRRTGAGLKRAGYNTVLGVGEFIEINTPLSSDSGAHGILGPVDQAGSCFGDSGGPMFRAGGDENLLVGTVHGGATSDSETYSYYVHLGRSDVQSFLHTVDTTYSLGIFDFCNAADPMNTSPCSTSSASMHIMAEIQHLFTKFFTWLKLKLF